jgi:hypothetical protein
MSWPDSHQWPRKGLARRAVEELRQLALTKQSTLVDRAWPSRCRPQEGRWETTGPVLMGLDPGSPVL